MENIELKISGMHCTGCSSRLERVLNQLAGVENAQVSFEKQIANICYHKTEITLDEIKEAIINAGFEV